MKKTGDKMRCSFCGEDHLERKNEIRKAVIKEVEVEYNYYWDYCPNLNLEFESEELIDENLNRARDAYRIKMNLLTSVQIKDFRKKYKLSQKDLAIILGLGEVTITRIESKEIQAKSTDELIRRLIEEPLYFLEKMNEYKEKLARKKYETILKQFDYDVAIKKYEEQIFKMQYLKFFHDTETTMNEINLSKIENMIIYFLKKFVSLSTLNLSKLLFFSDLEYYKEHKKGISGLIYKHMKSTVLPVGINELLKSLSNIKVEEKIDFENGITYSEIVTTKEFSVNYFSKEEMSDLEKIVSNYKNKVDIIKDNEIEKLKEDAYEGLLYY